jgi:hypothetical protein
MAHIEFKRSKVLLVEGADDRRFFSGFLGTMGLRQDVQIVSYEGKGNLLRFLQATVVESSFRANVTSLGITRDADEQGLERTLQSIRGILFRAGLSQSETSIEPTKADFNIQLFVLCNRSETGRLEEMILEAIEDDWRLSCIADYWNCIQVENPNEETPSLDENKSKLAIFLASQERPSIQSGYWEAADDELRLDYAVQHHYLNLKHPIYDSLRDFVNSL